MLTTRDLVDWLPSIRHINQTHPIVSRETQDLGIMRRMLIYEAVAFDGDEWIAAYHRHHADVRRYFRNRPNDLLEMNIIAGDGWDKLCRSWVGRFHRNRFRTCTREARKRERDDTSTGDDLPMALYPAARSPVEDRPKITYSLISLDTELYASL